MLCQMVDFNPHHRVVFVNQSANGLSEKHRPMLTARATEVDLQVLETALEIVVNRLIHK